MRSALFERQRRTISGLRRQGWITMTPRSCNEGTKLKAFESSISPLRSLRAVSALEKIVDGRCAAAPALHP